jgi:heme-degrading monooxygenase HmoA
MYIAMNTFRVNPERAEEFERAWRERDSYLEGVPGFIDFKLLRGPLEDGVQLYSSHTSWRDVESFTAWTESEAFRKAHAQGKLSGVLAGPPKFRGWQVIEMP